MKARLVRLHLCRRTSSFRAMTTPRAVPQTPDQALAPRHYSTINWVGLWTLYVKEVRRFMSVATQTILAPMVTTLLFLAVFVLALGHAVDEVAGEPYRAFLVLAQMPTHVEWIGIALVIAGVALHRSEARG